MSLECQLLRGDYDLNLWSSPCPSQSDQAKSATYEAELKGYVACNSQLCHLPARLQIPTATGPQRAVPCARPLCWLSPAHPMGIAYSADSPKTLFSPPLQCFWSMRKSGKGFEGEMSVDCGGSEEGIITLTDWPDSPKKDCVFPTNRR